MTSLTLFPAPTGYQIAYRLASGSPHTFTTVEVGATVRQFTATELAPESAYIFRLSAKTRQGWGEPLEATVITTEKRGKPPDPHLTVARRLHNGPLNPTLPPRGLEAWARQGGGSYTDYLFHFLKCVWCNCVWGCVQYVCGTHAHACAPVWRPEVGCLCPNILHLIL